MSLTATKTVDATADVSLRVPRGEAGDLEAGVADVIANVRTVEAITIDRVTSVDPTWTDIHVDVDVEVTAEVAGDDAPAALEAALEDGFGIVEVNGLAVTERADERQPPEK